MTPRQIQLLQESFAMLMPTTDKVIEQFYNLLFEIAPHYKQLFRNDMMAQRRMFIDTLSLTVYNIGKHPKETEAMLRLLGKRHLSYGVRTSDYFVCGMALFGTLERVLGENCTTEVKEAWTAAFLVIVGIMTHTTDSVLPSC